MITDFILGTFAHLMAVLAGDLISSAAGRNLYLPSADFTILLTSSPAFSFLSMPMMPFSSPLFLPIQLRLGRSAFEVDRSMAFGRVLRILIHSLAQASYLTLQLLDLFLQFGHLVSHSLVFSPKQDDYPARTEAGVFFPIFWRYWQFRSKFIVSVYIQSYSFPTAYHYLFLDSLALVEMSFQPTGRISFDLKFSQIWAVYFP